MLTEEDTGDYGFADDATSRAFSVATTAMQAAQVRCCYAVISSLHGYFDLQSMDDLSSQSATLRSSIRSIPTAVVIEPPKIVVPTTAPLREVGHMMFLWIYRHLYHRYASLAPKSIS